MRYRIAVLAAVVPAVLLLAPAARMRAQAPMKGLAAPTVVQQALRKVESGALRDLPVAPPLEDTGMAREGRPNERVIRNRALPREDNDQITAPLVDGVLQQTAIPSEPALTAPLTSFAGLTNQDNVTLFGFRVSPPDTVGDVGLKHYVQMTNLAIRVWDKAGTPLTAPAKTSSFWAPLGGICALEDLGDPIVIYDDMADRWLVSQFNSEDTDTGPHHQCIGISKSGDPTGVWYLYDFVMPNQKFNDYPKFGAWRDAYYMTDNQFSPFGFAGAGAFAFDRAKMLLGDPTASYIYFDLEALDPFIGGLLPADADGISTPPAGTPGLFSFFTADEFGDPEGDGLRLFEFRANFATPASSTFTEVPPVPVASFDPRSPAGRRDIEQPPPAVMPTHALDAISDRLLHRLQYRNFGTHESLVVTHTVNVGTGTALATHQAGVRYYELRRAGGGGWTVNEQATYSPDTDNRWMGSAAMDGAGNLAVGYSVSSLTTFPSIRYAGRLATDPPNGLHQAEQTLVAGSGVQRSTSNRWGDYSALTIDPVDDCTFWYTQEYYTAASQATSTVGWVTHIGSFKVNPKCRPSPRGKGKLSITSCETGKPIDGAFIEVSNGMSRATVDGHAEATLPPGRYTIRVSAPGYQSRVDRFTIKEGEKEGIQLCLRPVPIVEGVSAVLTQETCAPANGAVDPDERVTVAVTLKNVGAGESRRAIWAQLLRSEHVDQPSPLGFFGDLAPGESATRPFSFVARGACGSTIPLTFRVFDGWRPLDTVSFPLTLGSRVESTTTAENPAAITLNDNAPAVPYPSTITVAGVTAPVDKVTVTLTGFSHTWPADSVFVLVGPGGQAVTLMANRGSGIAVSGLTLTFDDDAARSVTVPIVSGTYRPSLGYGLPIPAPAPAGGASLGVFRGTDANGTWSLFAADQFNGDVGSVSGGWSITINAVEYKCTAQCALGTR